MRSKINWKEIMQCKTGAEIAEEFATAGIQERRDCFSELDFFMHDHTLKTYGKIGCLYGLQHSGKTALMKQYITSMQKEERGKCVYVYCNSDMHMNVLRDCLDDLTRQNEYIFIDGIANFHGFQGGSNDLSDYYGKKAKIVIADDNPLSIRFAMSDPLYDRVYVIQTTVISYAEWSRLQKNKTVEDYIRFGGTLSDTQENGADHRNEYALSVARNVLHTLEENTNSCPFLGLLKESYREEELQSVIEEIFTEKAGKTPELTKRNILSYVNTSKNDRETLNRYLRAMDLFEGVSVRKVAKYCEHAGDFEILRQPGVLYENAIKLADKSGLDKAEIEINICERTLKEIILAETHHALISGQWDDRFEVSQLVASPEETDPNRMYEADMIVRDTKRKKTYVFSINYSDSEKDAEEQLRKLQDPEFLKYIGEHFAPVARIAVIYRGEKKIFENNDGTEPQYLNAEEFLKTIHEFELLQEKDHINFGKVFGDANLLEPEEPKYAGVIAICERDNIRYEVDDKGMTVYGSLTNMVGMDHLPENLTVTETVDLRGSDIRESPAEFLFHKLIYSNGETVTRIK